MRQMGVVKKSNIAAAFFGSHSRSNENHHGRHPPFSAKKHSQCNALCYIVLHRTRKNAPCGRRGALIGGLRLLSCGAELFRDWCRGVSPCWMLVSRIAVFSSTM